MASLAAMLKESGYEVSGSDEGVYPPMSDFLVQRQIPVAQGYDPKNLQPKPDLVVVGNALSRGNPEIEYVLNLRLPFVSFPEALKISGPTLSFFAGMFPERGLALIVSKFEDLARSKDHSEDFDLELIEGITPGLTYRLGELGADSAVSLIGANPFAMFDALLTPMSEILDWIAQAHLFVLVKSQRFTALQNDGYRTIFDLERLLKAPEGRATLQKTCGWDLPPGYDLIASIHADGDYKRLVQLYLALGNDLP